MNIIEASKFLKDNVVIYRKSCGNYIYKDMDNRIRSVDTRDIAVFVANDFDADDWETQTEMDSIWNEIKKELQGKSEWILAAEGYNLFKLTWEKAEKHFTHQKD